MQDRNHSILCSYHVLVENIFIQRRDKNRSVPFSISPNSPYLSDVFKRYRTRTSKMEHIKWIKTSLILFVSYIFTFFLVSRKYQRVCILEKFEFLSYKLMCKYWQSFELTVAIAATRKFHYLYNSSSYVCPQLTGYTFKMS